MISDKIKEIVEQRKKSLEKDFDYLRHIDGKSFKIKRYTLSESIKNNQEISIISEIKPASPSLGNIRKDIDVRTVANEMESSGVIGLSVLTEPNYFCGSYENLELALSSTKIPCLMKDFVVDPVQYKIASGIGTPNILIINSICILENEYRLAMEYGLEPLIEIHEIEEIRDVRHLFDIGFKPKLIGVNNRNLKTLHINLNASKQIIPELKQEFGEKIQVVSESGIHTLEDIRFIQPHGADAFLIGSSIMQSKNIKEKIYEFRGLK
jgi:indole-3-glycerol phosphate synthase